MKNIVCVVSVVCIASLLSATALAQTAVPPPPRPADNGPSLAVTMKYIQDKLTEVGKLHIVVYNHDDNPETVIHIQGPTDWLSIFIFDMNNFVAHPDTCTLTYHLKLTEHMEFSLEHPRDPSEVITETMTDRDVGIPFKLIQKVMVTLMDPKGVKIPYYPDGKTSFDAKIDPPIFILSVQRTDGGKNIVYFADEDTANRVAKAMIHASELCGGGDKDPFQ